MPPPNRICVAGCCLRALSTFAAVPQDQYSLLELSAAKLCVLYRLWIGRFTGP